MTALSNWGRWGDDDELGTLNLVTAERVAAAAALVSVGRVVSCAWPVDPAVPDVYGAPQRLMLIGGAGPRTQPRIPGADHRPHRSVVDYVGLAFHGLCLPWLRERDVALIGCDGINDAVPSGCGGYGFDLPVHLVGLVAIGLWLLDNCDLDELAATCASLGRWEFMLSVLPLRLAGATGSPVNPVAFF